MSGANENRMRAAMLQVSDDTTSPLYYPGVLDTQYGQAMQVSSASRPRVDIRSDTHSHPLKIDTCSIVCNPLRSDPEVLISTPTRMRECVGQDPLLRLSFLGAPTLSSTSKLGNFPQKVT